MIARPLLEVADVFRQHAASYLKTHKASTRQRKVLRAIMACRTAALGGHVQQCDQCGHQAISYNSCRNRHCPKCQGPARARWLEARAGELLPVPYFHVVFTLPGSLAPLALQNPVTVYSLLFRAVAATLLEVASRRLRSQVGFLTVLHTWGQNLLHHPHAHCIVPAGGLAPDGNSWVAGRSNFFLPVRVLSRVFRGKFIEGLKTAAAQGELRYHGQLAPLAEPAALEQLLDEAVRNEWVVYAKPPFGGPLQVLKYLARYTHRVAISNRRLLALQDGQVTFRCKDYAQGWRQATMTLAATEFIRRFLLHVLPRSFVRIRYYGFMANRHRVAKLARCRRLLQEMPEPDDRGGEQSAVREMAPQLCPHCRRGHMHRVGELEQKIERRFLTLVEGLDTS